MATGRQVCIVVTNLRLQFFQPAIMIANLRHLLQDAVHPTHTYGHKYTHSVIQDAGVWFSRSWQSLPPSHAHKRETRAATARLLNAPGCVLHTDLLVSDGYVLHSLIFFRTHMRSMWNKLLIVDLRVWKNSNRVDWLCGGAFEPLRVALSLFLSLCGKQVLLQRRLPCV